MSDVARRRWSLRRRPGELIGDRYKWATTASCARDTARRRRDCASCGTQYQRLSVPLAPSKYSDGLSMARRSRETGGDGVTRGPCTAQSERQRPLFPLPPALFPPHSRRTGTGRLLGGVTLTLPLPSHVVGHDTHKKATNRCFLDNRTVIITLAWKHIYQAFISYRKG